VEKMKPAGFEEAQGGRGALQEKSSGHTGVEHTKEQVRWLVMMKLLRGEGKREGESASKTSTKTKKKTLVME